MKSIVTDWSYLELEGDQVLLRRKSDHPLIKARNCSRHDHELHIYLEDDRLPDIDQMPLLPVVRNSRPEGGDILQLSGYDY